MINSDFRIICPVADLIVPKSCSTCIKKYRGYNFVKNEESSGRKLNGETFFTR